MEWIYLKSLYEIRNDSNLSISKLTLDLNNLYNANIRNSKIWEWENGRSEISESDAKMLSDYFNVPIKTFI